MSNTYSLKSEISAKVKSLLGVQGSNILRDYFAEGTGVPDATLWHVVEDVGASVLQVTDNTNCLTYLRVLSGNAAGLDGICDTNALKMFCIGENGGQEFHFKAIIHIPASAGMFGCGFVVPGADQNAGEYDNVASCIATIYANLSNTFTYSSDMIATENNIATAVLPYDTDVEVEIVWSPTSVKYYFDGALGFTHVTRVNTTIAAMAGFACRHSNAVPIEVHAQNCEIWAE